jgi:alkylated DNA repair dioxygenase AlkB
VQQLRLIEPAPVVPDVPGLAYVEDYITREEELELLAAIDGEPWLDDWQRRRQVYGLSYGAKSSDAPPLPHWLSSLTARVVRDRWLDDEIVNAVINEYLPGQGIGLHRDYPAFGPTVVAVSLGTACVLELVDPSAPGAVKRFLDVRPRSLWVLGGQARSRWQHGIAHRQSDVVDGWRRPRGRRISVTLRTRAPDSSVR